MVRLEDLAKVLAVVNVSRAIEAARRELGLESPALPEGLGSAQAASTSLCPPGYEYYDTGVCLRGNYWDLPETPPEWFASRVWVHPSLDRNRVIQGAWTEFLKIYLTAYLLDKSRFPTLGSVWNYLTVTVASNPCRKLRNVGTAVNMTYVVRECALPDGVPKDYVGWNHTAAPGSRFNISKPFVLSVVSYTGSMPPMSIRLEYEVIGLGYRRVGISFMGVMLYSWEGHGG